MELAQVQIQTLKSHSLPWLDEALIVPLGDIQYGATGCDVERLKRHVKWAADQKNAYLIGMGDYVDFGSPSNRSRLRAMIEGGELYDTSQDILDQAAQAQLEELQEILAPTRGRWLGLLAGHHFWTHSSGETSDMRLCKYLGAPFLGDCAMVEVGFVSSRGAETAPHGRRASFVIWASHGTGSGFLQSAPLNRLERLVRAFRADVFLLGHHHKKVSAKLQEIVPHFAQRGTNHVLSHRTIIIAGTGGFLRGYEAGSQHGGVPRGSYIEQRLLTPTALGGVVITARPKLEAGGRLERTSIDLDISL